MGKFIGSMGIWRCKGIHFVLWELIASWKVVVIYEN